MFLKMYSFYVESWKIIQKNLLFLIGVFGGSYLFLVLLTYLSTIAINNILIGIITSLLNLFFVCLLFLGLTRIVVKLTQKQEPKLKDLFSQWNQIGNLFVIWFVQFLLFYLIHKFFMFFAVHTGLPNLFALIWIVIIIILFILFFSFVNFSIVKYQMGPIMSLKHNLIVTKRDIFPVMVFFFLFFLINLIGMMLFYIGLLVTIPLTFLAQAMFLDKLEEL